jgi:hypothetical protein
MTSVFYNYINRLGKIISILIFYNIPQDFNQIHQKKSSFVTLIPLYRLNKSVYFSIKISKHPQWQ